MAGATKKPNGPLDNRNCEQLGQNRAGQHSTRVTFLRSDLGSTISWLSVTLGKSFNCSKLSSSVKLLYQQYQSQSLLGDYTSKVLSRTRNKILKKQKTKQQQKKTTFLIIKGIW